MSFWGHHYVTENTAEGLALETLRWRAFDWDYLKPQSREPPAARRATQVLEVARSEPVALGAGLDPSRKHSSATCPDASPTVRTASFYATNLAIQELLQEAECARFQRPYDLRILDSAASAELNVMHVCGANALFDAFADYLVAAFSWAAGDGNPSLADGHRRTGKAFMGGVPKNFAVLGPHEVAERVRRATREMDRPLAAART